MEALNFLKFWRPTTILPAEIRSTVTEVEEEEEDDSFFDLELSATDPYKQKHTNPVQDDTFSKRKINPFEQSPSSKPRSPITLLKSAPGFRVFNKSHKTEEAKESSDSKRFSKEAIQRYLRLIKLLQAKSSKKTGDKRVFSLASPRNEKQGNSHSGIRVVYKSLGKMKSSPAASGWVASPARRDDSLLQQHDGIESAILHCKRSFDSSREASTLSRSSRDSPRDPIKISTSDCSMLPRYSSDKWMDPATARMSIEGDSISGM